MENKNSMKEIKTDKNIEMLNKNRMNFMKIRIAGGEHGGQIWWSELKGYNFYYIIFFDINYL